MKPPPFRYHAPQVLEDALGLLGDLENAKALAGGQSLVPMLNMRLVFPDHIVDINRVPELAGISDSGGEIVVGAMTRQRDMQSSEVLSSRLPIVAEALHQVGHLQTRTRGTLGGSLCHLDPAAELPMLAMLLDAEITVQSARGRRNLSMSDFPAFYMTPAMEPDELLIGVRLRPWESGHGYAFVEFARRHGDFAVVAVAVLLETDARSRCRRAAICLGGVGAAPTRSQAAETFLAGNFLDADTVAEATRLAADVEPMDDVHASAEYRRHLAAALTERALRTATLRAGVVL